MSMLEAMNQNCDVIAIRSPGAEEIIDDKKAGFLVSDENEMIDIINEQKHCDPQYLKKHIIENYTWDQSVKAFDSYLNQESDDSISS